MSSRHFTTDGQSSRTGSSPIAVGGAAREQLGIRPPCRMRYTCQNAPQLRRNMAPEERMSQPPPPTGARASATFDVPQPGECPTCQGPFASGTTCTPPCTHTFHAACVASCGRSTSGKCAPCATWNCRRAPKKLPGEVVRRYCAVQRRVDRGGASWGAMTKAQRREMNFDRPVAKFS
jgi:hypothetical protein